MQEEKNNTKEITIYDIAEILKISPSTVSRALNDHHSISKSTKKKVLETAQKLGYRFNRFAKNLREQKSYVIGVVIPRLDSYFMSTVISGMENHAKLSGYNIIITQSNENIEKELKCVEMLYNSRVDGIIISFSAYTKNLDHLDFILKKKIPLVIFDRYIEYPGITSIVIDNYKAAFDIVSHMINEGCKNIVHITDNINCSVYQERLNGYKEALNKYGLDYNEKFLFEKNLYNSNFKKLSNDILNLRPFPDGIFASNDYAAVNILLELKKRNIKIPDEIAIAGFNDDPIASVVEPNLTTIKYPGMLMGEVAVKTLIEIINGQNMPVINKLILSHELIVRKSTIKNLSI